ncbi:disease resistance protein RPV1-like [Gossypium hirsutum]|uniref:Disease resistance protein RPV1-like n=1 Tax=Gossypium hirsutum TaxID=3635 RepID=A0ABM2YY10_GOSHI|nr:disease resistance protein RPV1-like [Gossypium hirsutum]
MGGIGKTTLAEAVYEEMSQNFESRCFLQNFNPDADYRDLSIKFVEYTQYNPLALKVLGCQLYNKGRVYWESEMDNLKEYIEPDIYKILKTSFDGLDEQEKNIFLDIAIFFKGEPKENVEKILSNCYNGAESSIRNLIDKCLLNITPLPISLRDMLEIRSKFLKRKAEEIASSPSRGALDDRRSSFLDEIPQCISMHDMVELMGKDIVRKEFRVPRKRSRLWNPNEVKQVLKYNKGTEWIVGIKLDMSQIDFYFPPFIGKQRKKKLHADQVGDVSLPDELRLLCWEYYPFKSLSLSFDPKNLVVLKLPHGDVQQLWNEDDHQDLINLRKIVLTNCKNLKKIPNLLGAVNLEILCFNGCNSLVELPGFSGLASLKTLQLHGCYNLKKFPELPNDVSFLDLAETGIEEVPDSIEHIAGLETLLLTK